MTRCRLLVLMLAVLCWAPQAAADQLRPTAHITSQTTTHLVTAIANQTVGIQSGTVCVDAGGSTTGIAFQDTAGTNIAGTGIVFVIPAGSCFWFPTRSDPYFQLTASGTGLDIVTTVGSGPVEVYLEVTQR